MALSKVQALTRDYLTTNFASKILLLGRELKTDHQNQFLIF